jgi:hypothetical protein
VDRCSVNHSRHVHRPGDSGVVIEMVDWTAQEPVLLLSTFRSSPNWQTLALCLG